MTTVDDRAIMQRLAVCDQAHGADSNRADVYQHSTIRTCIRLAGTGVWVYSPDAWRDKWEQDG